MEFDLVRYQQSFVTLDQKLQDIGRICLKIPPVSNTHGSNNSPRQTNSPRINSPRQINSPRINNSPKQNERFSDSQETKPFANSPRSSYDTTSTTTSHKPLTKGEEQKAFPEQKSLVSPRKLNAHDVYLKTGPSTEPKRSDDYSLSISSRKTALEMGKAVPIIATVDDDAELPSADLLMEEKQEEEIRLQRVENQLKLLVSKKNVAVSREDFLEAQQLKKQIDFFTKQIQMLTQKIQRLEQQHKLATARLSETEEDREKRQERRELRNQITKLLYLKQSAVKAEEFVKAQEYKTELEFLQKELEKILN